MYETKGVENLGEEEEIKITRMESSRGVLEGVHSDTLED